MIKLAVQLKAGILDYNLEAEVPLDTTKEMLDQDCYNMSCLIWDLLHPKELEKTGE